MNTNEQLFQTTPCIVRFVLAPTVGFDWNTVIHGCRNGVFPGILKLDYFLLNY